MLCAKEWLSYCPSQELCSSHEQTDKTCFALATSTDLSWWSIMKFPKQKDLQEAGGLSTTEKKTYWTRKLSHIITQGIFAFFFNVKRFKVGLPAIPKLLNNNKKKLHFWFWTKTKSKLNSYSKGAGYYPRHFNLIQQSYEVKIFHPTDEKPELRVRNRAIILRQEYVGFYPRYISFQNLKYLAIHSTYQFHQELTSPNYNDAIVPKISPGVRSSVLMTPPLSGGFLPN